MNTLLGLGLFALLWFIVWWTIRKVLTAVPLSEAVSWSGTKAVLVRGTLWGGAVGVLFLVGAVIIAVVPQLFTPNTPLQPLSVLLTALIGGLIALIIGSVVGLFFALIDVVVVRVAYRVQTETART
ncbi:hypothetical protein [Haladaptatus sp. DFWS20]|uniref:hypothetical protein n=1 Tax=Haladaptatus sp. DFWS20 TaxID=3403467 RepID=UPI003EBF918C